jgi:hypothetical protein
LDSVPSIRRKVLKSLLKNRTGWLRARDYMKDCGYLATYAVSIRLDDMVAIGVADRNVEESMLGGSGGFYDQTPNCYMLNHKVFEKIMKVGIEDAI